MYYANRSRHQHLQINLSNNVEYLLFIFNQLKFNIVPRHDKKELMMKIMAMP